MALGNRLDVGSGGGGGGAACSSRSGSRTSQSYFRSPTLLVPTNDRGPTAADGSGDVLAAPRGSPRTSISAAVGVGGKLSCGGDGCDTAAVVQRRDSWQSERSTSLPALSTLRTSPTALVVGFKGQCHSLTPPPPTSMAMTSSSTGMAAAAYYGRRPPHLQAVSQSLVDAWVLMRQHSTVTAAAPTLAVAGSGLSRPKVSRALGERLVMAKQVQRAIDMAESDRRTAAAVERVPPALSPCRRQAAAPIERGAVGVGGRRRELKFRNIFFNFGSVASSSSFDCEESESHAASGFGEERSRFHETSVVVGGSSSSSSPTVKKRVRFMDALCWEVAPTALA